MGYSWFKVDSAGVLRGSMVQDMNLAQQGIWFRLLAFASEMRQRDGILRFAEGKPMPRSFIANQTGVPENLLGEVIAIACQDKNRLDENHRIDIWEDGTVQITNWHRFQDKPEKPSKDKETGGNDLGLTKGKPNDPESKALRGKSLARKLGYTYPEDAHVGIDAKAGEEAVKADIKKRRAETPPAQIHCGGNK